MSETDEEKLVREALQYFFDGFDAMDPDLIKQAFHPDAWSFTIGPAGFQMLPVSHWDDSTRQVRENPDHWLNKEKSQKEIAYIDITGDAAQARVDWVFSRLKFTDYYNLLKVDGRWYITNKTFHTTMFEDDAPG